MTEHPLEVFHFCPKCGSPDFEIHNALSRHCANCGFTFYQNPRASTAAFILNEKGELLVARRGKEPAKGTLDLPGGFVDNDENAEQGMVREIKEETGLDINPNAIEYLFSIPNVYHYSGMDIRTLDFFFLCHTTNDAVVKANDDAAELQWLPLREVYVERFGLRSIRQAVHRFLEKNC
ncbi:NUDIX domain-containing protein [Prevotella sp. MA2016]|uniref:NUDIX domain-containing protein n=1 Tax=Prevotella sp. MA2016 TaxID=1408310 RepID=UPI0004915258|nr:NUDIX domain-containing protein [Prevotella sp. MA2016]